VAIRDYHDKDTASFVEGKRVRAFEQCAKAAVKAITKLQVVERLIELRNPPSNHFEALGGARAGQYSIRIDDKWRVCFRWAPAEPVAEGAAILMAPGEPYDVEITNHYD
jgi:proteic killer suppression protein